MNIQDWFSSLTGDRLVENLFIQAADCLNYGQWEQAEHLFDSILATEPKNPGVFLGKALAKYKIKQVDSIAINTDVTMERDADFRKAMDFGNQQQADYLRKLIEESKKYSTYMEASALAANYDSEGLNKAAALFDTISAYRDAAVQAAECRIKAQQAAQDMQEEARIKGRMELMESMLGEMKQLKNAREHYRWADIPKTKEGYEYYVRLAEDIKCLREETPETKRIATDVVISELVDMECKKLKEHIDIIADNVAGEALISRAGVVATLFWILCLAGGCLVGCYYLF